MAKPTMEQEWEDAFPFLQRQGVQGVFLLALCHAQSGRHLERMLREWLPPDLRLCNPELAAMKAHWSKWYKPHCGSGSTNNDHLVRSAMQRMTFGGPGLRHYYVGKIEKAFTTDAERWSSVCRATWPMVQGIHVFDQATLFDCSIRLQLRLEANVAGGINTWAVINTDKITDSFTGQILRARAPTFTSGASGFFKEVYLIYDLHADPIGQVIDFGKVIDFSKALPVGNIKGMGVSEREANGLRAEVVRQLHALGIPVVLEK